jgi:hypothetical protein
MTPSAPHDLYKQITSAPSTCARLREGVAWRIGLWILILLLGGTIASRSVQAQTDENYALRFDGDDNVAVANADEINTSIHNRRTIEAWFRVDDKSVRDRRQIIYEEGGFSNGFNLYVYDGTLYVGAWSEDSGWSGRWLQTTDVQSGRWHHVALVFDATAETLKGYLNGAEFGSGAAPVAMDSHTADISIGSIQNDSKFKSGGDVITGEGHWFSGGIDEVRIWNEARSQSDIQDHRFSPLTGEEANLAAYWPFSEGEGSTTADASGNDNTGTINGAEWISAELPEEGDQNLRIADPAEYATAELKFDWNDVGATYRLELATAPNSAAVVQTVDAGSATSVTVDASGLEEGQAYYARVLGSTDGGSTYAFQSGFTDGTTVDRTPPTVNRPVGRLTEEAKVAFSVSGSDNVKLDSFRVQISADSSFASVLREKTIRTEGSVVYDGTRGTTYFARAQAIDGTGQESAFSEGSSGVTIPKLPDLTATNVRGPSEASSGQSITVSWTVSNEGKAGTNKPKWTDGVYLSSDDSYDSEDQKIGSESNVSFLSSGGQYAGKTEVALPRGIEGTYYLIVWPDDGEVMAESNEENNTAPSSSLEVTLSPYADLEVTDITVPSTAFSGDSVRVSWTVTNQGTGPAAIDEWTDALFLSADDQLDFQFLQGNRIEINEVLIAEKTHQGRLATDSSYTMSAKAPLPVDSVGSFHLFAYTDKKESSLFHGRQGVPERGDVYEYNQELDNWSADSIDINLTPPPDLTVQNVKGPANATSGDEVEVSWTVANEGPGPVPARSSSWNDIVYLSPTPSFDSSTAQPLQVFTHDGTLQSDSEYTATGTVTIPDSAVGKFYVVVETDLNDDVFEHIYEDNNRGVETSQAKVERAPYPDVQVSSLSLAASAATAGKEILVRYRQKNEGTAPATGWRDSIYVSSAPSFSPTSAQALAAAEGTKALPVGTTRERKAAIRLPDTLSAGTYYLYVRADAGEQAFEYPDTTGNVVRSGPLDVTSYPPVDLSVEARNLPDTALSGSTIQPELTVTNTGEAQPRSRSWIDAFYLSKDTFPEESDIRFGESAHETGLRAGESYTLSPSLSIPNEIEGEYQLLLVVDDEEAIADANRSNNLLVRAMRIEQPAPTDLKVTSIETDSSARSGQPLQISWTVENTGSGAARDSVWHDAIYLSRDPSVSEGDVLLGTVRHEEALGPDATYRDSLKADVPLFASGSYFLLVQTDRQDDIFEHQAEVNNTGASPVELTLPAPSDLLVESVDAPTEARAGEEVTVGWTIKNEGSNPAEGTIREGVFVSKDSTWDVNDPFLGAIERSVSLDPGSTKRGTAKVNLARASKAGKDGTITGPLPGVKPGEYHVIVRTDIANNIRETEDENNLTASAQTTKAKIPSLRLGSSTTLSLGEGESRYFRVEVPSGGKDLSFNLSGSKQAASLKLYLRGGAVPTPNEFDASANAPFESSQSITLSEAEAGTYYLLAQAESSLSGKATSNVSTTLSAKALTFSVKEVAPDHGGNGGVVTTYVRGAKFTEESRLFLQTGDGTRTPAQGTYIGSSTRLKARLNLRDQPTGTYDVVVQNPSGSEVVAKDAFTVEPSEGADPYVETQWATDVRAGEGFTVEVTVGNRGNENAVDYYLLLGLRGYRRLSSPCRPNLPRGRTCFYSEPFLINKENTTARHPRILPDEELSFGIERSEKTLVEPSWFYEIPPGQTLTFSVHIEGTREPFNTGLESYEDVNAVQYVHGARLLPMPRSQFSRTAALEDLRKASGFQYIADAIRDIYPASGSSSKAGGGGRGPVTAGEATGRIAKGIGQLSASVSPIPGKNQVAGAAVGRIGRFSKIGRPGIAGGGRTGPEIGGEMLDNATGPAGGATETFNKLIKDVFACVNIDGSCNSDQEARGVTNSVRSVDPNDIVGPDGQGEKGWVAADRSLGYKIRFENDPERATAPAQVVEIRHPLDEDVDERSFELGSFGFANQTFDVPDGRASFSKRLDVRDSLGVFVDVTAGLDVQANEVFWRFVTIDPETGSQPTSDPTAGFLPVNDSTGRGEGFARYRVRPDPNASTGTEIEAQAEIVFDQNVPIETPVVVNTVDTDDPTSNLTVSPRVSQDNAFRLAWEGADTGSGLDRFQLYVAKGEGGRFEPYESSTQDTSLVFVGEKNTTYRFYTRATDFAGNREPAKASGDTTRALPVELVGFEANRKPGAVLLTWKTASETNNAGFYVERAAGEGSFEELQFVEGHGTTTQPQRYRFQDSELPFKARTLRYRLRQVDTDGTSARSKVLTIERTDPRRFALHPNYPNPPAGQTKVPYEVAQRSEVEARIYDILGREVKTVRLGRKGAGRYVHQLDVSRLASGTYFFELRAEQGGETLFREVRKITVVR